MHACYSDITSRIKELPSWYDSNGTPRYGEFYPTYSPNIYAKQVALVSICCQICHRTFQVEMHWDGYVESGYSLETQIQEQHFISYKDPPMHFCSGDSMMSIADRVLEFWILDRKKTLDFIRRPDLEIKIHGFRDDLHAQFGRFHK